jgi:hypothetical protein
LLHNTSRPNFRIPLPAFRHCRVWPAVAFSGWVLPWVGPHISWALVAISALLMAFSLSMLALTAFQDPGFIPRSPPDEDVEYG